MFALELFWLPVGLCLLRVLVRGLRITGPGVNVLAGERLG